MRTNHIPIHPTSIAMHNVPRTPQRQGRNADVGKLGGKLAVHLMLRQSQGKRSHFVGKVVYLDAIKLRELDVDKRKFEASAQLTYLLPNLNLQFAKLLVSNNQEVSTTTGGVEELHPRDANQQLAKLLDIVLGVGKIFIQVVEEERLDNLHNVGHGGVVHPQRATLRRTDYRLNHRTEDVGIDVFPIQFATFDDEFPCPSPHLRDADALAEQASVHVGELREDSRYIGTVFLVHHIESRGKVCAEVASVLLRVSVDGCGKEIVGEDAGIFGKVAEEQPGHE